MSLQKNLKDLLNKHKMSQVALCNAMEDEYELVLFPATLNRWLSGTQPRNIVIISAIASYFETTTEQLLLN